MSLTQYLESNGVTRTAVTATTPMPVTSSGADSAGNALPSNFDNLAQVLAYDGSSNLSTITVTDGTSTWVQTLTYTTGNLTGVSAWVKQ